MRKNSFNKIKITDAILEPVGEFKAIMARGVVRKTLSADDHKDLVHEKYNHAKLMKDHITLFRVSDKKTLPHKEQDEHTVPGPAWTPPSSLGFVMGALSNGSRVWLATEPTDNINGFSNNKGEPSILARETSIVVKHGWMARETQKGETYGRTNRNPKVVFTPPLSPRNVPVEDQQRLMNVNAGWNMLPITLDNLIRLSTPIPKKITDFLKKFKLVTAEVDGLILRMIDQDHWSLIELGKTPTHIVRGLLLDKEVVALLSDEMIEFGELLEIHSEYIEDSDNALGTFSFKQLYDLINGNKSELNQLLSGFGLSIDAIIKLYYNDSIMFCAFANDNAISFFQKYGDEIDIERMAAIYCDNQDLFYALINDQNNENILQDTGVEEFIEWFEEVQSALGYEDEESPYNGLNTAYDILVAKVKKDGCPEGYLRRYDSSDDENEHDSYKHSDSEDDDEDDAESLASQFEEFGFAEDEGDLLANDSGMYSDYEY